MPVGTPMPTFQNRGITMTTSGTGFLQTPLYVADLTNINASYSAEFGTFSPVRIFTPLGSNITDAIFSSPGSGGATPATTSAFGPVFSDVDTESVTKLELFDIGNNPLFTAFVTPDTVADAGLSFLGVVANAGEQIARVRITTGNSALGPDDQNGDSVDVVVMDDFIFAEPIVVPEPTSVAPAVVGIAGAAMAVRAGAALNDTVAVRNADPLPALSQRERNLCAAPWARGVVRTLPSLGWVA